MIAALYIERGGVYWDLAGVDPWSVERDARLYRGPWPVVAHPPCQRWGRFAEGSPTKRGYTVGDDGGCFKAALASVKRYGGVLEHPAHSRAWPAFKLPSPFAYGWSPFPNDLWVCEVEQGHYGHVARKRTWLLVYSKIKPPELAWGSSGQRLPVRRLAERGYEAARRCGAVANQSSAQRQRTPIAFRDMLILIAQNAQSPRIERTAA